MRNKTSWTLKKHILTSFLIALISLGMDILFNVGIGRLSLISLVKMQSMISNIEAASIGIIGGADGPTAVFLGSSYEQVHETQSLMLFVILVLIYKPTKYLIEKYQRTR